MNKGEPPRRQLCQWSRLAHHRFQISSISGGRIPIFGSKTDCRDDLVENPKLNPNNYCH